MFEEERSGRIAVIAHCLLNQNSRARGLAKRSNVTAEIIKMLQRGRIGIIQMPCPELIYAGAMRQPQTREQYDNVKFKEICANICKEIVDQIQEYARKQIDVRFILGVDGSPSCSVSNTRGILIEELQRELKIRRISVPFYGISYNHVKNSAVKIEKRIKP